MEQLGRLPIDGFFFEKTQFGKEKFYEIRDTDLGKIKPNT